MADYGLLDETNGMRYSHSWWRIAALIALYVVTTALVFLSWNSAYDDTLQYPPLVSNVPDWWYRRAHVYANSIREPIEMSHDFRLVKNQTSRIKLHDAIAVDNAVLANSTMQANGVDQQLQNDGVATEQMKLVCYYATPDASQQIDDLRLIDVNTKLCTHINVGLADVHNSSLILSDDLIRVLQKEMPAVRAQNPQLKVLLWVGGADSGYGFAAMVRNHNTRKVFIQSLKQILRQYALDGIDLDWEFPSAYNKERQHFSQLLYEIRQEYRREKRDYLLTVAVAAPDGIALFAYDVPMINKYADFANLMSYDYHFYTRGTPFTGLNAPLYARHNEHSILTTLNINYSVNWWLANGLERKKLIVGLPTYGHSFTLVNPFNNVIGAPAEGVGGCGSKGFTTYSQICWFNTHNVAVSIFYDQESCSPFLSSGTEWISFENEMSMECKARYIKANNLGGAMLFSLNTDDFKSLCNTKQGESAIGTKFPLIATVKDVLTSKR